MCYVCLIGCGRVNKFLIFGVMEGLEYESIWVFGVNFGINDFVSIIEVNY